jgi:hypothetical protein
MDDSVPMFDEKNYSTWRIEMKVYLKAKGAGVWKEPIHGSFPLNNKSNFASQKNKRIMMHCLSRPFSMDSQFLSKKASNNVLLPRIYG